MDASDLPIRTVLPALRAALADEGAAAVLHAPPGAGKSTVVPLALLDEPWARGKRIVMLEPRRLAARAVARRMAATLGERVGERVGYRMRLDTLVSKATRIEVVTEGVLTRMLQSDPSLEGVALVIFDEFHERSLQADLGLALTLDAREALVPELRLLVMSATLEVEPVARLLGEATVVRSEGRTFPVETRYVGRGLPPMPSAGGSAARGTAHQPGSDSASAEQVVARIVRRALDETRGDVLVFLPGAPEIRRVQSLLEAIGAGHDEALRVVLLYGDLDAKAQDEALAPSSDGFRKIVLATNIAETSVTIEGVRVVVDSGLVRRAIFDPATGMSRLETQRISRASAEQRQGRAGRTAPGVCYRAWSEAAQRSLAPTTPPEMASADLAALALELASWGVADAATLRWLDPPPAAMLASARDLLRQLGALDHAGRITGHGREMSALPVHPRLAHMLLAAREIDAVPLAARLAALLSDRDVLRGGRAADIDIRSRLNALTAGGRVGPEIYRARRFAEDLQRRIERAGRRQNDSSARTAAEDTPLGPERPAAGNIDTHSERAAAKNLNPRSARPAAGDDDSLAGLLLALAYPDRIGRRRPGDEPRYTLSNGRGAALPADQPLARAEFLVALDLDDRDRDARVRLAAAVARRDLETFFAERLESADRVEWSPREHAVLARRVVQLGALILDEKPLPNVPGAEAGQAMLEGIRELGLDALPWTDEARDLQARVEFVRGLGLAETSDWPALDDASLAAELESWLAPWIEGMTRREHLARIPLTDALTARLGWARVQRLDELAPARLEVPSGSKIRIDYRSENAPLISVRLQEVFGLDETPRIADDRAPLTFALLSPARRPVQVTRDLASFWRGAYQDVRKDLRGRYPKHHWPEDPLTAMPTRSVKKRC